MADEQTTRRDALKRPAIDPITGKQFDVLLKHSRLLFLGQRQPWLLKETAKNVPAVLIRPLAVFEGLTRDSDDEQARGAGWRCYCGRPSVAYATDGSERDPWPNNVYLVFVNEDCVAYNWRWEPSDDANPDLPRDYQSRFKRRLL